MSERVLGTIAAIESSLLDPDASAEKVGLFARSLRWQSNYDRQDLDALMCLGDSVMGKRGDAFWEAERAVLEVLGERASTEHVPLLARAFRYRGTHGDDRRRLAMQALSRVAAVEEDGHALEILESALSHHKADTRGWAIGFISNVYLPAGREFPESLVRRLEALAAEDASPDVRVEAATALVGAGLAEETFLQAVIAQAQEQKETS